MPLLEEAHKAARTLLDHAYVRIIARSTPDATFAAALLAHALRREGVDFHVSWARRLDARVADALAEERPDLLVLVGLSGDAALAAPTAGRRIAIDHAAPTLDADAAVHDDASLAGLAHLVAAGVSKRNVDLAPLAIAGALASWRHVGGWRGLDAEILQDAVASGVVQREASMSLPGATLVGALAQLDAPFVAGVTGRARNVKKLVSDLHLPGDGQPAALAHDDGERLGSFLAARLLQQRAPDAAFDALFRPTLRALQGPHTGLEAGDLARQVEAACASGRCGLAFSALWPDPAAGGESADLLGAVREELVAALLRAERDARREGRLFVAEAPRAELCRPLADRLALSLARAECVTVVHAPEGEGAFVALRSWSGSVDCADVVTRAGGPSAGTAREAHLWTPDATRALKALAEAVA